jgi:hypothetical protein
VKVTQELEDVIRTGSHCANIITVETEEFRSFLFQSERTTGAGTDDGYTGANEW